MNNKEQFTPGPWVVKPMGKQLFIESEYPSALTSFVCDMQFPDCQSDEERETAHANAHLIAAAPAMYEALLGLVICSAFNSQVFEKDKESHKAWTLARRALAQAEGR